jgi:hypothetical protein
MRNLWIVAFVLFVGTALFGSHMLAPEAHALGFPSFEVVDEAPGPINFIPMGNQGMMPASVVDLMGDLDGDGVYETSLDNTVRAVDGSFTLVAPSWGSGDYEVVIGVAPDARPREKCVEWGPGKWACWWE